MGKRTFMTYNRLASSNYTATRLLGVLLVVWLIIGALAAGQRHYYSNSAANCASFGTTAVTIIAGPLNYMGANPRIDCHVPQPSK